MAERLEEFDKLNVDRLIYEKSKTEAIIESLEDGIVMLDPNGTVAHINELAAIILGVEREAALGSPFDDLDSSHPHYLRIRAALAETQGSADVRQVEVDLHVRGRDHTYLLKPVPLRHGDDGPSFGTILILQDITYLRDKDRARTNLVATLSHELKTPLTSLALAAELLDRSKANLDPQAARDGRYYPRGSGADAPDRRQPAGPCARRGRGDRDPARAVWTSASWPARWSKVSGFRPKQKQVRLEALIGGPDLRVHGRSGQTFVGGVQPGG